MVSNMSKSFILFTKSPFVIAEMSGNHNQSLERALQIVDAAAAAGVDALKIQTYTADTMTLDSNSGDFSVTDSSSLWAGKSLYQLYQEAFTPWEWHDPIFKRCKERGIVGFSTPFDETAVDFLEKLEVPFYKIASFENTDIPLIRKVAATGKPMIISTGMASIAELDETVQTAREFGSPEIVLLKCTSAYPAPPSEANLATIPHLQELFQVPVGISDHTLGIGVSLAAVALGACVIEKHFTLCRAEGGVDSAFSMEPAEMMLLVEESRKASAAIGKVWYGVSEKELESRKFRRSLYVVNDMKKGDAFCVDNTRAIRPGFGLSPKQLDVILGRKCSRDIARGTALSWELVE